MLGFIVREGDAGLYCAVLSVAIAAFTQHQNAVCQGRRIFLAKLSFCGLTFNS